MPSQQLPRNSRVDTLPDDLKGIAEKLIRKKLGIEEEPEVFEKHKAPPALEYDYIDIEVYSRDGRISRVVRVDSNNVRKATSEVNRLMYDLAHIYDQPFEARNLMDGKAYDLRTKYTQDLGTYGHGITGGGFRW